MTDPIKISSNTFNIAIFLLVQCNWIDFMSFVPCRTFIPQTLFFNIFFFPFFPQHSSFPKHSSFTKAFYFSKSIPLLLKHSPLKSIPLFEKHSSFPKAFPFSKSTPLFQKHAPFPKAFSFSKSIPLLQKHSPFSKSITIVILSGDSLYQYSTKIVSKVLNIANDFHQWAETPENGLQPKVEKPKQSFTKEMLRSACLMLRSCLKTTCTPSTSSAVCRERERRYYSTANSQFCYLSLNLLVEPSFQCVIVDISKHLFPCSYNFHNVNASVFPSLSYKIRHSPLGLRPRGVVTYFIRQTLEDRSITTMQVPFFKIQKTIQGPKELNEKINNLH